MAKQQATEATETRERAERKELLGHAEGTITEMNSSTNANGGKSCRVDFPNPVGNKQVYISGRAIKARKLKVGSTAEFSCFELEDGNLEFTLKVTTADEARRVFRK